MEEAFPVIQGEARLEAEVLENGARLRARLITFAHGDISSIKEQELDWARLDVRDLNELAERARERLREDGLDLERSMPRDLVRKRWRFEPVGPFDDAGGIPWARAVAQAVAEQANAAGYDERLDVVEDWPLAPRTVYLLWFLDAVAGGNGLGVYMSQPQDEHAMYFLDALREAGCRRLEHRYREALDLSAREGGELQYYVDDRWLDRERLPFEGSWRDIDSWEEGGTWALLRDELRPALARYVEQHRAELAAV